ncbi:MAG: hypothetical protein HW413_1143 [Thermoleophilia bacterium]|nr:hypothetical protein [Thermoleophilia bacterium]
MKRKFLRAGVVALGVAAAAVLVGTAWAGTESGNAKIVPFTAKYAGTATVKITDGIADIAANGVGTGTPIGKGKITGKGKGDSTQQPCVPFTGPGSMTGTKGNINFLVLPGASGCGDEEGQVFSVSGRAKVLKGTKAFKTAKGTLKFTGVYDRGQGTFSIKFTGKLTV